MGRLARFLGLLHPFAGRRPSDEEAAVRELTTELLRHVQPRSLLAVALAALRVRDARGRIWRLLWCSDRVIDRRRVRQASQARGVGSDIFARRHAGVSTSWSSSLAGLARFDLVSADLAGLLACLNTGLSFHTLLNRAGL